MTKNPSVQQIIEYLPTRDLRYYGLTPFDNSDAAALTAEIVAAGWNQQQQDALVALYTQILPTLPPVEQGSINVKLHRCPPVPANI